MIIRKSLSLLGAVAVFLCSGATAQSAEHLNVGLALFPGATNAPLFLALQKGWFSEAGLDVSIQDGRGSAYSVQVVGAGQIDVGEAELSPMASALDRGAKVTAITQWFHKSAMSVIVDRSSDIQKAADLKGKNIVALAGGPWVQVLDPYLKRAGLKREDVNMMFVDGGALATTYTSRKADAMMTTGPWFMPYVDPIRASRKFDAADAGIVFPGVGLVVTRDTLENKKAALTKFVAAQMRAIRYIYDGHQDEAVAAMVAARPNAKLNAPALRGQIDAYRDYWKTPPTADKPEGWQSAEEWAAQIKVMEEAGVLKPGRKPADFFTNEIVDAAAKM
jgi:NitT/TauT family transport system substrate-binding protein